MARRVKRDFASVRQLPSRRWQVRYTGPDGIRHTAPKTFAYRAEADNYVEQTRKKIYRETWDSDDDKPEKITFGSYATTWLAGRQVAGRPIKARTREHYQDLLDDHLIETFGNRQLAAIKPKDVREWYAVTLTDQPTMRSHAYSLLRTIMGSAVNDELIDGNPCRIVGAGRAKRVHKIRPASVDELATLTAEMPERVRLMVTLASWCALRFGETIELQRGDIDVYDEVIRIRRAAVRTKDVGFEVTTPKSDAGVRDVAIPPHVIPQIEQHLSKYVGSKRDSLLFPNERGQHLQPSTLMRHWYKARKAAGREDLRWHDLRHSGAVLAAATGASLAELMARLGHSTPQAAMRYQHAAQGRDREIAALLSKLASNRGGPVMGDAIKYVVACRCDLSEPIAYIDDSRPTGGIVTITGPRPGDKQIILASGYNPEIEDWRAPDAWVASMWGSCKVTEIMWKGTDEREAVIGWTVRCGRCSQQAQMNQSNLGAIADRMAANLSADALIPAPAPISADDVRGYYGDDGWFEPSSEEVVPSWEQRYVIQLGALIDMSQRNG